MSLIAYLQPIIIALIVVVSAACAFPSKAITKVRSLLMQAEDSIDVAFSLHGHYVVYTGRAMYLMDDARIDVEHKEQLQQAMDNARPFADPLILATLELVEFKEYAKYDLETFHVLKHNVDFWIKHFQPHVEILINVVRGTRLRFESQSHGNTLLAIGRRDRHGRHREGRGDLDFIGINGLSTTNRRASALA